MFISKVRFGQVDGKPCSHLSFSLCREITCIVDVISPAATRKESYQFIRIITFLIVVKLLRPPF